MNLSTRASLKNSRAVAAQILYYCRRHGDRPDRHLEQVVYDRAFITEMVLGAVRNRYALDWIIDQLVPRTPPDTLYPVLHVGLYQLLVMEHVEPYAAVYETVEAAGDLCGTAKKPFVNAVLRRALREKEQLLDRLEQQAPAIRYSHPSELIERWTRQFGAHATVQLCKWNNERPELILRVRPPVSRDQFIEALSAEGIRAAPHAREPFVVLLSNRRLEEVPGYAKGWFTVQDPATLQAVDLLNPQPGERLLDACAAPGGKTIAMADILSGKGTLVAADLNKLRLKILRANLARCGQKQVHTLRLDATDMTPDTFGEDLFDGVLLDVPCSNTGVIRRRPDARMRLNPTRLQSLLDLQSQLLDRAATLLRPGGRLVYSTCSLEREENEEQITHYLERHPSFQWEAEIRTFPPRDRVDGIYAARLRLRAHS